MNGQVKKARILIVDDEQEIRDSLSEVLTDEGFLTYTAENGLVALEMMVIAMAGYYVTTVPKKCINPSVCQVFLKPAFFHFFNSAFSLKSPYHFVHLSHKLVYKNKDVIAAPEMITILITT